MVNFYIRNFFFLLFLFISIIFIPKVYSQPTVEEVNYYPLEPTPLSNVTLIIGINNDNSSIDEVCLVIQECMGDMCSIDFKNLSMNYMYSCCMDFYEIEFKGTNKDATQIKYNLEILSNGTWYNFETGFINLVGYSSENINSENENKTPGFEFLFIISSIILVLLLKKRVKKT